MSRKPRRGPWLAIGAEPLVNAALRAARVARRGPGPSSDARARTLRLAGVAAPVILVGGVVLAMAVGVGMMAEGVAPVPALVAPVGAWVLLCAWVRVELGLVRHPVTGDPSPAIGPANVLSFYRGWASVPIVVIGLARRDPSIAADALGVTAAMTDLVDGTVAVRLGHESRLGRLLDPVLDSFLFSAIAFDLSRWGLLPWWVAALVATQVLRGRFRRHRAPVRLAGRSPGAPHALGPAEHDGHRAGARPDDAQPLRRDPPSPRCCWRSCTR